MANTKEQRRTQLESSMRRTNIAHDLISIILAQMASREKVVADAKKGTFLEVNGHIDLAFRTASSAVSRAASAASEA